jgi:hypothetical protein
MNVKARNVEKLLTEVGIEFRFLSNYSGRYMFGRSAKVAFDCSVWPESTLGKRLLRRGFTVDNFGKGYVYYC